jgi:hypothetical protein
MYSLKPTSGIYASSVLKSIIPKIFGRKKCLTRIQSACFIWTFRASGNCIFLTVLMPWISGSLYECYKGQRKTGTSVTVKCSHNVPARTILQSDVRLHITASKCMRLYKRVRSEVLTAVTMKTVFWDVTHCSPVDGYVVLGATCLHQLQGRHYLDHRLTDGDKVVSLMRRPPFPPPPPPPEDSWYSFLLEAESIPGP